MNVFAHGLADTVISPINDSFLDLDVIATRKDPSREVIPSPYTDMVRSALRARGAVTSRKSAWYVVRNRMSALDSRNERAVRDLHRKGGQQRRLPDGQLVFLSG